MSVFKKRSNYLKEVASKNKLIAHGREVDGEIRQSFFRMNDEEELMAGAVNWIHFPCMVMIGLTGRYTSDKTAVSKRKLTNELMFLQKPENSMDMDAVETAYDIAFEAMEQFVSYLYNEFATNGCAGNFDDIDLSRFAFNPVGPIGDGLVGWQLLFEDGQFTDNITTFDNSKWF